MNWPDNFLVLVFGLDFDDVDDADDAGWCSWFKQEVNWTDTGWQVSI